MPGASRTNPSATRGAQADLAARLQQTATGLEGRLNRRDTLIELIRSVNGTLDPSEVGDALLGQATEWLHRHVPREGSGQERRHAGGQYDCLMVVADLKVGTTTLVAGLKVGATKTPGYVVPTL
jgi:hypothetical protein